jgi:putative methyltransferase (TIGR04325 family)
MRALAARAPGQLRFIDGFADWQAAQDASTGYSQGSILERVASATDEVVAGRAAFERDAVTFDRVEYRWPVAAALLWAATRHDGRLRVLDFGGSLGSSYRQQERLLRGVDVQWGVVEQPGFVEAGRAYEDGRLRFFETIEACCAELQPTVALLSGVLQYLPSPHAILDQVSRSGIEILVIDRTPFTDRADDLPTVQEVPPTIYPASYPAWLLSRERLLAGLAGWELLDEFPSFEPSLTTKGGVPFSWHGMLLARGTA